MFLVFYNWIKKPWGEILIAVAFNMLGINHETYVKLFPAFKNVFFQIMCEGWRFLFAFKSEEVFLDLTVWF